MLRSYGKTLAAVAGKEMLAVRCLATQVHSAQIGQKRPGKNIVLIDGVRTPFATSGTVFNDLMAYELEKHAVL